MYDELFKDSPPTPREERLLDLLSRVHLELAYQLDFRNEVVEALNGESVACRPRLSRALYELAIRHDSVTGSSKDERCEPH